MFVVCVLELNMGDVVFDSCVVLGGKIMYIVEWLKGIGKVMFFDLYVYKVCLIK